MRGPVGKTNDLVFDARAISRASRFDLTVVHGGAIKVTANLFVNRPVRMRDPTRPLLSDGKAIHHLLVYCLLIAATRHFRERHRRLVSRLQLQPVEVNRLRSQPWRGSGLEAVDLPAHESTRCEHDCLGIQPRRRNVRCLTMFTDIEFPTATVITKLLPVFQLAPRRAGRRIGRVNHTFAVTVFDKDVINRAGKYAQIRSRGNQSLHFRCIQVLI